MNFRKHLFFLFLFFALIVGAAYSPLQENTVEKEAVIMQTLLNGLAQLHYQPRTINNDFSKEVFDLYLERIDGGKRFFTQKEIDQLKKFELRIDDEANSGTYEFFNLSVQLLEEALLKTQKYYRDILAQPFDFTTEEFIEMDGDKRAFPKDEAELKAHWVKMLKYETLNELLDAIEKQEKEKKKEEQDPEFEEKSVETLEEEARKKVLGNFNDWFKRMNKLKRVDRMSVYLNAVTNSFDPHTGYYKPIEKQNFDIGMSGRLEGIGARLQTKGDETSVVSIVPGGPAWKQKELEVGDVIVKVAEGEEEPVDVTGMVINEVVQKVRGNKGTEVRLTVRKSDGTEAIIPIIRDVIILDEGFAKSVILNREKNKEQIGYIHLPRFYADFKRKDGRSCAKDVAAEIEKLKQENINGIILDLRNNGGGSLRDVIKMAGLFIEEGPIVQVKARIRNAEVLVDEDEKVQYDGPLIVLVNAYSASASEILAAALQDYGRAVIVGGNTTFGKGTVQRFFDLDRAIKGNEEVKPLGELKLTIQKFYRVNGGSTQLRGVTPDIILPDRNHYIKVGEQEHEYAMEWSEIEPVDFGQEVIRIKGLDRIKKSSSKRVAKNEFFDKMLENATYLNTQKELSYYPLQLEAMKTFEKEQEETAKKYKNVFKKIEGLNVRNLTVDIPAIEADEAKKGRIEDFHDKIKKDAYIEEALNIMEDLIDSI